MRKHHITCHLEDNKPIKEIQYIVNSCATLYIENLLKKSGLPKDKKIAILEQMLMKLRVDQ